MTRAVILDVGGPLDIEIVFEALIDADICTALASEGCIIDAATYADAERWSVEHFAPSFYRAVIWRLTSGNARPPLRIYDILSLADEAP